MIGGVETPGGPAPSTSPRRPEPRRGSGRLRIGGATSPPFGCALTVANDEHAKLWTELTSTWGDAEELLEQVGGPPGRLATDRLGLRSGQTVIDVGCGAGRTTLELAGRVSPGGTAVGVDFAPAMIARAREGWPPTAAALR